MELFIFGAILVFGGGIAIILKKGFNEIIKGLESNDERLKKIEEQIPKS
ncbi:hypothetical protein [uncultured Draconibacterium sp.]|nr:hypothetical protein [uncultured Draconibacterium sp.]